MPSISRVGVAPCVHGGSGEGYFMLKTLTGRPVRAWGFP